MAETGKAYGFFDCKASKKVIEEELPYLRACPPVPSELELSLIEGVENLKGDLELLAIAKDAKEDLSATYVLEATYPHATNKQTAEEVMCILEQMRQSHLYDKPMEGVVVYKENNAYVCVQTNYIKNSGLKP